MEPCDTSVGLFFYPEDTRAEPLCVIGENAKSVRSRAPTSRRQRRRLRDLGPSDGDGGSDDGKPTTVRYTGASWNGEPIDVKYGLFIAAGAGRVTLDKNGNALRGDEGFVDAGEFVNPLMDDAVYTPWSSDTVVHWVTVFCYFYEDKISDETLMFFRTFAMVQRPLFRKKPMNIAWLFSSSYGERAAVEPDTAWWRMRGVIQVFDETLVPLIDRALITNTWNALGGMSWEMTIAAPFSHALVLDGRHVMMCDTRTFHWSKISKGIRTAATKKYVQAMEVLKGMHLPRNMHNTIKKHTGDWVNGKGNGLPEGVTITAVKELFTAETKANLFAGPDKMMVSLANAMIYTDGDNMVVGPARPDHFVTSASVLTIPDDVFTEDTRKEDDMYCIGTQVDSGELYNEYRQRMWPDDPVDDQHPDYPSVEYEQFLRTQAMNFATGRMDKKATFVLGKSGDEGKSLLIYLLSIIYGENFAEGSSGCVTRNQGKTTASGHQAHLEPFMRGKALVVISDLNPSAILNLETVKRCTGEDAGSCRLSYGKDTYQFWYKSKMMIITNDVGPLEPGFKLADARRMLFHQLYSRFVEPSDAPGTLEEQMELRIFPLASYGMKERSMLASEMLADIIRAWPRYAKYGLRVDTRTRVIVKKMSKKQHAKLVEAQREEMEARKAAFEAEMAENPAGRRRRAARRKKLVEIPVPPPFTTATREVRAYAPSHYSAAASYHMRTNQWVPVLRAIMATNGTGRLENGKSYKKGSPMPEKSVVTVTEKVLGNFTDFIPTKTIDRTEYDYSPDEIIENLEIAAFFLNVGIYKRSRNEAVFGFVRRLSYFPVDINDLAD